MAVAQYQTLNTPGQLKFWRDRDAAINICHMSCMDAKKVTQFKNDALFVDRMVATFK